MFSEEKLVWTEMNSTDMVTSSQSMRTWSVEGHGETWRLGFQIQQLHKVLITCDCVTVTSIQNID